MPQRCAGNKLRRIGGDALGLIVRGVALGIGAPDLDVIENGPEQLLGGSTQTAGEASQAGFGIKMGRARET